MNEMICPYCGESLEDGKLFCKRFLTFVPNSEEMPKYITKQSLGRIRAINLKEHPLLEMLNTGPIDLPDAYACRKCKVLIVPYVDSK